MPEGDTIRRLADKIGRRFAGQRCVRCVTRDEMPDLDEVVVRLQRQPDVALAAGMLDQRNVAGFGDV
jgi:formamidopyrimidine-DNA glycosylase